MINDATLKRNMPTFVGFFEKRRKARHNRLPKHLRPLPHWPMWLNLALNLGIGGTLIYLMVNQDDFLTEGMPALAMVICALFLFYTIPTAIRFRTEFAKAKGRRLAKWNLICSGLALLLMPICIAFFLEP